MGTIILSFIVKLLMYGVIVGVGISFVPAWMKMLGGTKRMITKTGDAITGKGFNISGLKPNMNKVKNYFKNGGGMPIHTLPDSKYSDIPNVEPVEISNDESENKFKFNPVEAQELEDDQFKLNPVEADIQNNETSITDENNIDRVDLKEVSGETIKVVNKSENNAEVPNEVEKVESKHSESYNDQEITDEFFNDVVWNMDSDDIKGRKKRK